MIRGSGFESRITSQAAPLSHGYGVSENALNLLLLLATRTLLDLLLARPGRKMTGLRVRPCGRRLVAFDPKPTWRLLQDGGSATFNGIVDQPRGGDILHRNPHRLEHRRR